MANNDKKMSYFNTLMFTIITGIVSLCMLALLFFEFGKKFMIFIIAFEVGVFILITYSIVKIMMLDKKKQAANFIVKFEECPDYYAKKNIDGTDYCFNDYVVNDSNGNINIIRLTPTEINNEINKVPKTISVSDDIRSGIDKHYEKFKLRELQTDNAIPKLKDKCGLFFKAPPDDAKYNSYQHYNYIPWTYAKGRCEGLI